MTKYDFLCAMQDAFTVKERDDGSKFFCIDDNLAGEHKQEFSDLCMFAHDGMLPEDHRYEMIRDAVDLLIDHDLDLDLCYDAADQDVPCYNSDLLDWLGSHLTRIDYVDQALSEIGFDSLIPAVAYGYLEEFREVIGLVHEWLDRNVEEEC